MKKLTKNIDKFLNRNTLLFLGTFFSLILLSPFTIFFNELLIEHIVVENGLPDNTIRAIMQDRPDFIWLATRNGRVKYDVFMVNYGVTYVHDKE